MKTLLISLLATMGLVFSTISFGHSDHHHPPKKPVTEDVAKKNAQEVVSSLIKAKKIDASWEKAEFVKIKKKKFSGKEEWVAIFMNKKVKDDAKKKLFIFMKLSGEFLAANYTGK